VLGLGRLGTQQVLAWSPNLTEERASAARATRVERDELFRRAGVLTLHLVLSERSAGLVGSTSSG
jgi:phosphoglycerate dehydrogenase-like enzyme